MRAVAALPLARTNSFWWGTRQGGDCWRRMSDDPLENMRARIERCRRLAKYVNDPRTTEALIQMAEQGEIDLARLIAEREEEKAQRPPG